MKYGKIDDNQKEIVAALREHGAFVQSLADIGKGCPDLLCAYAGSWFLLEIKDGSKPPSKRRLTEDEIRWQQKALETADGDVFVVKDINEALAAVGIT